MLNLLVPALHMPCEVYVDGCCALLCAELPGCAFGRVKCLAGVDHDRFYGVCMVCRCRAMAVLMFLESEVVEFSIVVGCALVVRAPLTVGYLWNSVCLRQAE